MIDLCGIIILNNFWAIAIIFSILKCFHYIRIWHKIVTGNFSRVFASVWLWGVCVCTCGIFSRGDYIELSAGL